MIRSFQRVLSGVLAMLLVTPVQAVPQGQSAPSQNIPFVGTGSTAPRSAADRSADVVNVKDFGALGDGQMRTVTASIASGSKILTVGSALFGAADVGKTIGVQNAGVNEAVGHVTAIPVVSPGVYTSLPTITLSGSPTTAALPADIMGVVSATLTGAGSGCPVSSTLTATLAMNHTPYTAPQISVTIGAGGTATAVVSIMNAGVWANDFPTVLTAIPAVISGCTTNPTVTVTIGLVGLGFGSAYPSAGYGAGYAPTGVIASVSGGSPIMAAVLGTPVVTPWILPLVSTIVSVQDATHVTLANAAVTTVSNASTGITWGHVDTAFLQAAVNGGGSIYFPPLPAGRCYLTDEVLLVSNTKIFGQNSALCSHPGSYYPMFGSAAAISNLEIFGLSMTGNLATMKTTGSGNSGISPVLGSSHLKIHDNSCTNFEQHCVFIDGGSDVVVTDNSASGDYFGGGFIVGTTTSVADVTLARNRAYGTQWAGVGGLINGGSVVGNVVYGSNMGYGDSTHGNVQDCITGYSADPTQVNTIISQNWVYSCGNHGIHWGGDRVTIADNIIYQPLYFCIFAARAPNTQPTNGYDLTITGNKCYGATSVSPWRSRGIGVRNYQGGVVSGNLTNLTYAGLELDGWNGSIGVRDFVVSGNVFQYNYYCIWATQKAQYDEIVGNICSYTAQDGIRFDNIDNGAGTYPNFYNHVGINTFDGLGGNAINEVSGNNFNNFEPQRVVNSAGGGVVVNGVASYARPQSTPYAVGAMPSASTYKNQCVAVTGSTTGNTLACSNGALWQWVKDNSTVSG